MMEDKDLQREKAYSTLKKVKGQTNMADSEEGRASTRPRESSGAHSRLPRAIIIVGINLFVFYIEWIGKNKVRIRKLVR